MDTRLNAASRSAAQAPSSEPASIPLADRSLKILIESSGAERAVLSLMRGGELYVRAELSVEPERLLLDLNEAVESSSRLPKRLVQHAARSKEPLSLGQTAGDSRFDEDPYLSAHRPASALVVPLSRDGRIIGVFYLEHSWLSNAFPEARVKLVTQLASYMATSLGNAELVEEVVASNKRLERELEERTAELRAAEEAARQERRDKSAFLSSMSHELRTPLNCVLGYAQILEHTEDVPPKARDGVRAIRRSGELLLKVINDVVELTGLESGKTELCEREIHLPSLIRAVVDVYRARAEQKNITLTHEHIGPVIAGVSADDQRLRRVLLCLLSNAIKFTAQGNVTLRTIALDEPHSRVRTVRFEVRDTGPGIAPQHRRRIFSPFQQLGDAKSRAEGGGLGLSIVKESVERMGGSVDVESQLGKGSVFSVTLRLSEADAATASAGLSWEQITGYTGERRSILVVDDSAESRLFVRDLLAPVGFELLEAPDGAEALAIAQAKRPAVILTDLSMPDMDGYEVTRRLRQTPFLARTVILAFSASSSDATQQKSVSAGCDDFLPKPLEANVLFEALGRHLDLEWTRRERLSQVFTSAPRDKTGEIALSPPPAGELNRLLSLANKGRIRALLDELKRLEEETPALGPWLAEVRSLAQSFELEELLALLRAYAGRAGCVTAA